LYRQEFDKLEPIRNKCRQRFWDEEEDRKDSPTLQSWLKESFMEKIFDDSRIPAGTGSRIKRMTEKIALHFGHG